jgi:pimeloyl-ACP methyl ester carboxylesterase
VWIVGGEDSSSHPRSFLESQAVRFPHAAITVIAGATHFVPMERPREVARSILQAV